MSFKHWKKMALAKTHAIKRRSGGCRTSKPQLWYQVHKQENPPDTWGKLENGEQRAFHV